MLGNKNCILQHLILGHNNLNIYECEKIATASSQHGLITLDIYGNECDNNIMIDVKKLLNQSRIAHTKNNVTDNVSNIEDIVDIISEYTVGIQQCLYRCHKWNPKY